MNRLFTRRKEEQGKNSAVRLNIGVMGIGRNAGTTFVAACLAFYFKEKGNCVTFVQCGEPKNADKLMYDSVAMDKRFSGRAFVDVYRCIAEGLPIKRVENFEAGINWILITPDDCDDRLTLDDDMRSRLLRCARNDVCVFDMDFRDGWAQYLRDMDMIIGVVDPLPSRMIRNIDAFREIKQLELSGLDVKWIVNKVNPGVNKRQVSGFLKTNDIIWLENFDTAQMYGNEFFCRFPWENNGIKVKIMENFTKVSH